MAVQKHLFSFLSFCSLALVLASFQAAPVNALSLEHHQYHARSLHHHNLLAKKRSTKQKRCRSRPTPSSAPVPASSAAPTSSKQAAAAAGSSAAPAKQSSAVPAPPPPAPSSSSKPQSSAPAPPPPQSTSSSSVAQRLKSIFPNKALAAFGGSPDQLSKWSMDAYYNWGVEPTGPGGPRFIAMLWGTKNQDSWQTNVLDAQTPPLMVKTYNEAELPSQSNLSPQDAASFWNAHVEPLVGKGTLIGCPAVTSDPGAGPWLESFFSSCNNGHANCGCDYMDVHFYGTDAGSFISWIQSMQKQFPMPMIVSEFACQSFTGGEQCNPSQIQEFATTMTQFFLSTDYIYAYSAFGIMQDLGNVNPENGLMNADGSPNALALTYYPSL